MIDFLMLLACVLTRLFRSRARLEAEILVLRHQLNILQRKSTKRAAFKSIDRLVFAGLYRLVPGVLDALKILKPETVIRWHRAGFRAYWRWKHEHHPIRRLLASRNGVSGRDRREHGALRPCRFPIPPKAACLFGEWGFKAVR